MANIMITGVQITPNPVYAARQFIISVEVVDKIYAILDTDGNYIMDTDGNAIERIPRED